MDNIGLVAVLSGALSKAPSAAQVQSAVNSWLDDHPEATTTVEDGSITEAKLYSALKSKVNDAYNTLFPGGESSIDWADYGSTSYPYGFRQGRYNPSTGGVSGAMQCARLLKLINADGYEKIIVKPPAGKFVEVAEYSANSASADNYVTGKTYDADEVAEISVTDGRYYGLTLGTWPDGVSTWITAENVATVIGKLSSRKTLVSQEFGTAENQVISQKTVTNSLKTPLDKILGNAAKLGRKLVRGVSISSGNEYELNFGQFVRKNWEFAFSGKISSFTSIKLGLNYKAASLNALSDSPKGLIVEITGTSVTVTRRDLQDGSPTYVTELQADHGLTISDYLQVVITGKDTLAGKIVIECNGQVYSHDITDIEPDYYYCPFVLAESCAVSDADISFCCKDFAKDILIVGDSYARYVNSRWPYYLHEDGYDANCCINAHGGAKSYKEGYTSIENLLQVMTPKYIFWCLGMNDGSDTDANTPSDNWKTGRDKLLEYCTQYNIIPVFATIPNVTDGENVVLHDGKNKWIRESGYQYVDFALAVGADNTGNWRTGLRESATGFHPSELGAKVLYMQAITDFPQLTISK